MAIDGEASRGAWGGTAQTWLVVVGLGVSMILWGLLLFFCVGDKGPPPWDFGVIDDLPGSSAYSTHGVKQSLSQRPVSGSSELAPQHVGQEGHP